MSIVAMEQNLIAQFHGVFIMTLLEILNIRKYLMPKNKIK